MVYWRASLYLIQNGAKFSQCIQITEQGVIKYEKLNELYGFNYPVGLEATQIRQFILFGSVIFIQTPANSHELKAFVFFFAATVEVKEVFLTDLTSLVQSVECQVWSTAKKNVQKNV